MCEMPDGRNFPCAITWVPATFARLPSCLLTTSTPQNDQLQAFSNLANTSKSDVLTVLQRQLYRVVGESWSHYPLLTFMQGPHDVVKPHDYGATKSATLTEIHQPRVEIIKSR